MTPATRTRSPRGQGDELREEILDAAEQLLIETQSEEAVSIRAVADRVGVTPPSIYRHFADKATLMFSVCDRQFHRLDVELRRRLAIGDDPVEVVQACGLAYVQFGLDHPEAYRIMFMGHSDLTPDQYRDEVLSDHGAFAGLIEAIDVVSAAGRLKPEIDVHTAALVLWESVHGLVSLRIAKPNFPWPPLADHVATHCGLVAAAMFEPV
jgi:AcrR family transcriptional regulator